MEAEGDPVRRKLVRRLFPLRRDESGMSLLEIVVAMTIFAIMMLGAAQTIGSALSLTRTNRHRSVAANLAAQEMDAIRSADFTSIVAQTSTVSVDNVPYTVSREVTWVATSATSGPCDASAGSPELLRVRVSVAWANMRGVQPVVSDTTLTPPIGAYDPNTGHVGVKVLDRDAAPAFNVPVTVTGPVTRNAPTNSDGCAFFGFLPEGTYTVTLSGAGYVDRQSNASPSQTAAVTIGEITAVQFDYDRAASLELTPLSDVAYPIPAPMPLTIANSALLPAGRKTYSGSGVPRTIGDLFPFLDGYQVWAGSCADADPEADILDGDGLPIGKVWPGATRDPIISVEGGTTATANVHMHDAQILATDSLGGPLAGVTVVATHEPDSACETGETLTLGVTDAAGNLNVAVPFGTWELSLDGFLPPTGGWATVVIDPNAHAPVPVTVVTA